MGGAGRIEFAAIFVAALLVWCWALVRFLMGREASRESWLAGSTIALSLILGGFAIAGSRHAIGRGDSAPVITCGRIDERTAADAITQRLGKPSKVVSEEESRGPGAEAWVYEERRCVVHLLDQRVESVDYE
jgi:hypothetical protein